MPDRVAFLREVLAETPPQLPGLDLAINADETPVVLAVAVVDTGLEEMRLQYVQPCKVHVHHEAFETALGGGAVIEIDRELGLALAGLEHVPPLRGSRRDLEPTGLPARKGAKLRVLDVRHGKGDRQRRVSLSGAASRAIVRWERERTRVLGEPGPGDPLFVTLGRRRRDGSASSTVLSDALAWSGATMELEVGIVCATTVSCLSPTFNELQAHIAGASERGAPADGRAEPREPAHGGVGVKRRCEAATTTATR